jgi:hypothetical protein
MWNPVLFAIYFKKAEILKDLLSEYVANPVLAIRLPPVDEFTEYISPGNCISNYLGYLNPNQNIFGSVVRLGDQS